MTYVTWRCPESNPITRAWNRIPSPVEYDAVLSEIDVSDAVELVIYAVPYYTNTELLQRLLAEMHTVTAVVADVYDAAQVCGALERENCAITTLDLQRATPHAHDLFLRAFKKNTSLRHVKFDSPIIGLTVVGSATVERITGGMMAYLRTADWDKIFKMPSLQCVEHPVFTLGSFTRPSLWPDAVLTPAGMCLRHPGVRLSAQRCYEYALRECLDGILPDCVVDDIILKIRTINKSV
jgi:hypothetical protein